MTPHDPDESVDWARAFWLNVIILDVVVTGLLGSPLVGERQWWPWWVFPPVALGLFPLALVVIDMVWYVIFKVRDR